jgi:hypothetical protein
MAIFSVRVRFAIPSNFKPLTFSASPRDPLPTSLGAILVAVSCGGSDAGCGGCPLHLPRLCRNSAPSALQSENG